MAVKNSWKLSPTANPPPAVPPGVGVRVGVPALALKFAAVTPEEKAIQKAWLTERYHAPSDDLNQPINPDYAVAFNRYLEKLIVAVADAPVRPSWNADSFFRRFAK